jgi:hypothetical protein
LPTGLGVTGAVVEAGGAVGATGLVWVAGGVAAFVVAECVRRCLAALVRCVACLWRWLRWRCGLWAAGALAGSGRGSLRWAVGGRVGWGCVASWWCRVVRIPPTMAVAMRPTVRMIAT